MNVKPGAHMHKRDAFECQICIWWYRLYSGSEARLFISTLKGIDNWVWIWYQCPQLQASTRSRELLSSHNDSHWLSGDQSQHEMPGLTGKYIIKNAIKIALGFWNSENAKHLLLKLMHGDTMFGARLQTRQMLTSFIRTNTGTTNVHIFANTSININPWKNRLPTKTIKLMTTIVHNIGDHEVAPMSVTCFPNYWPGLINELI